jgi:hypothetical protein
MLMAKNWGRAKYKALASNPVYIAICRGLTFTYFTFTLLWFWSTWKQIKEIAHLLHVAGILGVLLVVFAVATGLLAVVEFARKRLLAIQWDGRPVLLSRYCLTVFDSALAGCSLAVGILLKVQPPEIIYKAF